jgi:HEAT repeat protein
VPVVDELAAVLVAAGDDGFLNALARFTRLGDDACAALLAMVAGEVEPPPTGAPGAHPRDVMEDVMDLVVVAARQWPDRFEAVVAASPALRRHSMAVRALSELGTPTSEAILVDAARERAAGNGFLRETAVRALLVRRSRALTDLLPALLGDRHDMARAAAVDAAFRYGDDRSLPALRRLAANPRRKPRERERAHAAITKIGRRATTS